MTLDFIRCIQWWESILLAAPHLESTYIPAYSKFSLGEPRCPPPGLHILPMWIQLFHRKKNSVFLARPFTSLCIRPCRPWSNVASPEACQIVMAWNFSQSMTSTFSRGRWHHPILLKHSKGIITYRLAPCIGASLGYVYIIIPRYPLFISLLLLPLSSLPLMKHTIGF
jgi:hypothetical protein